DYYVIQVDSEQMAVTALTLNADGTAALTVVRHVNGTTAATHAGAAPVLLASDQRGLVRPAGTAPDIGAFQTNPLVANTTTDTPASPRGDLSLRQAVNLADLAGATMTITFDPTAFAAHQTISLSAGPLELSDKGGLQAITGPAAGLTLDAGGRSRVFRV